MTKQTDTQNPSYDGNYSTLMSDLAQLSVDSSAVASTRMTGFSFQGISPFDVIDLVLEKQAAFTQGSMTSIQENFRPCHSVDDVLSQPWRSLQAFFDPVSQKVNSNVKELGL